MTHKELVEIGYKWVLNKCAFAFKELVTNSGYGEIPDVIGFRDDGSFLLEAKATRNDYLSDKHKRFRKTPEWGMGDWRFYITPKGLIKVNELPNMWGLIEVSEKGKARITHNPFGKGNMYYRWKRNIKHEPSEIVMMKSALRRLHLRKRIEEIYEPNYTIRF